MFGIFLSETIDTFNDVINIPVDATKDVVETVNPDNDNNGLEHTKKNKKNI